jgi:hypothetical protein
MNSIICEFRVEDQVLLNTHGILRKQSTPCKGPYPLAKVYKNGTVQIQN